MNSTIKSNSYLASLPEGWEEWPEEARQLLLQQLKEQLASTSPDDSEDKFAKYRPCPEKFAKEILGQTWWAKQIEFAHLVRDYDRVAVKAGHSVGKCVHWDDEIPLACGTPVKAHTLIGTSFKVMSATVDMRVVERDAYATDNGIEPCVEIEFKSGVKIRRTKNHPLWCGTQHGEGWVHAGDINPDALRTYVLASPKYSDDMVWCKVTAVSDIGPCPTVAITVPGTETFLTPFVEHNTHAIAGIAIWFLHAFSPAIVVTTAPSTEQVTKEIWQEMRRQSANSPVPLLPGLLPKKPEWHVADMHYAMGLCTDKGERFRGKHGQHMLFIFDEANGCPEFAHEEVANMCTAPCNKIVMIGNPTEPGGPFYDAFKPKSKWATMTISSLEHPNVLYGRQMYPGAVSLDWIRGRIDALCVPMDDEADIDRAIDFEFPQGSGQWWKPSGAFMSRVLGEFPAEGPDTLISVTSIIKARKSNVLPIDDTAPIDLGCDIARKGTDHSVVWARQGPCVIGRWKWQNRDLEYTKRRILNIARDFTLRGKRIGTIAVDATGLGAGTADGLQTMKEEGELRCDRVIAVIVGEKARDTQHYCDKRTEIAFGLAERFRQMSIDLSRVDAECEDFEADGSQIKFDYDNLGRWRIESKDKMRDRLGHSPDDFDGMALCFIDTVDTFAENYALVMSVE